MLARTPYPSPAPRSAVYLLGAAIVAGAVVYSFRLQSFLHAKEIVFALTVPVIVALSWRANAGWMTLRPFLPLWISNALALLLHGFLGAARLPEETLEACLRVSLMLLMAALFVSFAAHEPWRVLLENAFVLSATAVGLLALLQYFGLTLDLFPVMPTYNQRAYSVFGNQNLLGGYMALATAAILARSGADRTLSLWRAVALALVTGALIISGSRTAWFAGAAGVVVALVQVKPDRALLAKLTAVAGAAGVMAVIVAPEASIARLAGLFGPQDEGAWVRLWIWDGALRMIRDHIWIGVGPGNFAYWTPQYQGEAFYAYSDFIHYHNEIHTLHAHSEPLELVAEGGMLSAGLVAWFLISLRRYRGYAWAPLITFIVFALFNTVSHSMPHMLWFLFLAAVMLRAAPQARNPHRSAPRLLLAGALCCSIALAWTIYVPSYLLRRAEVSAYDPALYARVLAHPWPDAEAQYRYGMALLGEGEDEAAYEHLQRARRGNDTGALHLALAVLEYERGNETAALHHVRECRYRWPSNLDAFRLHMRLPYQYESGLGES